MLKSKWLGMVLDVDFMTLTILKLEFSFVFLEFIVYFEGIITKSCEKPLIYYYLRSNKMLQKLIYSIFVFLSSKFSKFYVFIFIFRIIFGRTCYGAMVLRYLNGCILKEEATVHSFREPRHAGTLEIEV